LKLWEWQVPHFKDQPYRLTKFATSLNYFPPELKYVLLPTDSRRRLDRFYLERGHSEYATLWKKVGEYRQREDHRAREKDEEEKKKELSQQPTSKKELDKHMSKKRDEEAKA